MLVFDLIAEYIALLLIIILICTGSGNKQIPSLRYKVLRLMYAFAFSSTLITIANTILITNYIHVSTWILYTLTSLQYILGPTVTICGFFYTLAQIDSTSKKLSKRIIWFIFLLPYIVYILLILSNIFHKSFFYFSPSTGYQRGETFIFPYILAYLYIIGIYIQCIKNLKKSNTNILIILCISVTAATVISFFQVVNRHILLTNFASVIGILLIHLNIQNTKNATDRITGLFNRYTLLFYLDKYQKKEKSFSIYVFSLQGFKLINEKYGTTTGDAILATIAQYFRSTFPKDILTRFNGDEFVLLTTKTRSQIEKQITTIIALLKEPIIIHENEIKLSFVYTRVDYPYFTKNIQTLLSTASYAITLLKKESHDDDFMYDYNVCKIMERETLIIDTLKDAIANDGFEIHYQPIYSNTAKCFSQAEALVRLKHGDELQLYPNEFIPIAERTDLIIKITYIVLEQACKDFRKLINLNGNSLSLKSISVNFPYKIFFQSTMIPTVLKILHKYSIKPEQIKIEITERSLISDNSTVKKILSKMREKGFIFELDDFGIEYSNMSVFLKLPINLLKIDRSLVVVSVENRECRPFFQNLVQGIHSLDKSIIVEGVENTEQLNFIENCGCEYIQGFVYSKPLPINELELFLNKS